MASRNHKEGVTTVEKEAEKKVLASPEVVTRTTPGFKTASEVLGILIFFSGCMVMLGWVLDIPVLKSIFIGHVSMKINAAFGFIFSGLSIWILQVKHWENPHFKRMALLSSSIVFGIGLATVLEYALGRDLGIDQIFVRELPGGRFTSSPGRMAFNSAINFTLIGLALFWIALKTKSGRFFAQLLLLPTAGITLLSLIGYIYKAPPLVFGLHFSTAMALHTQVLFLFIFLATLFCHPGCGLMVLASSDANGGKVIRRIFPVTILLPVILGWLKLRGETMGIVGNELGSALVAIVNLTFITLYIFLLSFWLDRSDAENEGISQEIRGSEKFLKAMINSISDVFYVFDKEGKFVLWNGAFEKVTGYSNEEISRMRPTDFFDEKSAVNIAKAVKVAFEKGFITMVESVLTKDGRRIPMFLSGSRAKDLSGEPILCGTGKDITELKKAEENLARLNQKNKLILGSAAEGILGLDLQGNHTFINPAAAKMLGYEIEELLGRPSHSLWHHAKPDGSPFPMEECHIYTAYRDGRVHRVDTEVFWRKDGTSFPVDYTSTPIYEQGQLAGAVVNFADITERKHLVEELKRSHDNLEGQVKERTAVLELTNQKLKITGEELKKASKAKSEFLANMSHELRTPLASVIGFSEVIYDEKFGALNERQKKYIQNVLTSGRHLLSLINDILDLSKVESGKMVLEVSPLSVNGCLEEVLELTKGLAFSKKIDPVVEIPEDLGEIHADLRKIKQVVFNLLSNAIKFTPAGGKVGLRARRDAAGIEVAVWDTGIGIPSENLEAVFEAFTRLVDTYTQETEGTGLGLTISKKIVELHGGKMWIESEGVGKGTTVKFTIPARGV